MDCFKKATIVFFSLVILHISDMALANGVGLYISSGSGTAALSSQGAPDIDVDTSFEGYGLIFESNLSKRKVYNYRLTLGAENIELSKSGLESFKIKGYSAHSDFGFGGSIKGKGRLWGGISLRTSFYLEAETSADDYTAGIYGFGLGPVFGINVTAVPVVSFCVKAGYNFGTYSGEIDNYDIELKNDNHVFVNLGIVFRYQEDR